MYMSHNNFDENFYTAIYEKFSIDVNYKWNNYHVRSNSSVYGKGLLYYVSCNMALTLILPCDHLRVCCWLGCQHDGKNGMWPRGALVHGCLCYLPTRWALEQKALSHLLWSCKVDREVPYSHLTTRTFSHLNLNIRLIATLIAVHIITNINELKPMIQRLNKCCAEREGRQRCTEERERERERES